MYLNHIKFLISLYIVMKTKITRQPTTILTRNITQSPTILTRNITQSSIHTQSPTILTRNITQSSIHLQPTIGEGRTFANQQYIDIKQGIDITLQSYIKNKKYKIYLHNLVNNGSYNDIYAFSGNKQENVDPNLIIRISNHSSTSESINSELRGIKIQYRLSSKTPYVGTVIDYGQLYNRSTHYKLQEYSIIKRYGYSLNDMLNKDVRYNSEQTIIDFMYHLLQAIHTIHKNNYIHLDLKPENILLENKYNHFNNINSIDFVIVDFGGAKECSTDKSSVINGQMASAAFSPPEIVNILFGKKSDIWAYGIICYLICVRKTYLNANGGSIFMNNKNELKNTIHKAIGSLNVSQKIKDFLKSIFIIDIDKRPNTKILLGHPLFK